MATVTVPPSLGALVTSNNSFLDAADLPSIIDTMTQSLQHYSLSHDTASSPEQERLSQEQAILEWIQKRQNRLIQGWSALQCRVTDNPGLEMQVDGVWSCIFEMQNLIDEVRWRIEEEKQESNLASANERGSESTTTGEKSWAKEIQLRVAQRRAP